MFIEEQEGNERLRDPRNVLTRVQRDDPSQLNPSAPVELPDIPDIPDVDVDEILSDLQKETAPFDPKSLKALGQLDPTAALVEQKSRGRYVGRYQDVRNRTISENASIAVTSMLLGGSMTENLFGPPPSSQTHLKTGRTSPQDRAPKEELLEEIYRQGRDVTNLAFKRLNKALNLLDDEKLGNVNRATDLVKVATGMSRIVRDLTPKETGPDEGGVHFHIWRPEQNQLSDYETVVVGQVIKDDSGAGKADDGKSDGAT